MKLRVTMPSAARCVRRCAMTLLEMMVSLGIGAMVLAMVAMLVSYGGRSFASLGNYSILEQQSRIGIDRMTREIRQANAVLGWQTNALPKWLLLTNSFVELDGTTNGYTIRYTWANDGRLVSQRSTDAQEEELLVGCDSWEFGLWKRAPRQNQDNAFYPATNASQCTMITMTWKCSRFILGTNLVNTEAAQTMQIVLRDKR